jgi:hypothetical protein
LAAFAATSALFLASPGSAQTFSTYEFTGNCEDCSPANTPATATLILKDYQPGTAVAAGNLVQFTYGSNIISWDTSHDSVGTTTGFTLSGTLGGSEGAYEFGIRQSMTGGDFLFFTQTSGYFNLSILPPAQGGGDGTPPDGTGFDYGMLGTWTLVADATGAVPNQRPGP